jgi:hypothetical protein
MELMEQKSISTYASLIKRKGEELILNLSTGTTKKLVNNKSEEDYEVYQFIKVDENGYFVFAVYYYESYEYILINSTNGKLFRTIGPPRSSLTNKKLAACNYDMIAAFTYNGLHLASYTTDSIQSEVMIDFMTWGPEVIIWKDDSTLYVKQKSQVGEELKEVNNYAAIRIRKNAIQ